MRFAILSDIHGSLIAFDAVLRDIRSQGTFDQIIIAGDLCWFGPQPAQVIDRIRETGALALMGNTDSAVLGKESPFYNADHAEEEAHPLTEWTRAQLSPVQFGFLQGLPFSRRFHIDSLHSLLAVHANPRNLTDPIGSNVRDEKIRELIAEAEADLVAHGHVHINTQRTVDNVLLVDVASAGYPRDGDTRAAWDIVEFARGAWHVTPRRVEYDMDAAIQEFRACGQPEPEKQIELLVRARY
jgi:putative phosphoesterase